MVNKNRPEDLAGGLQIWGARLPWRQGGMAMVTACPVAERFVGEDDLELAFGAACWAVEHLLERGGLSGSTEGAHSVVRVGWSTSATRGVPPSPGPTG